MSLPVWPSAFIRLAVAMWSASSTLQGRPNLVPLARDAIRFNAVRSFVSSRTYSAACDPRMPIITGPRAVLESQNQMSLAQGREFVSRLLVAWLASLTSG
jgi:hypothetical protein